jgi:hypothetical protein
MIDRLSLRGNDRTRLDWVVSHQLPSKTLTMLNRHVHWRAWYHLTNAMMDWYTYVTFEDVDLNVDRRFFFLTACWDDGLTSVAKPCVDLLKIKQKVRQLLNDYKLNGLCVLEAHPFRNKILDQDFRSVWFHIHAIGWIDDPRFDHKEMERAAQRRFPNSLNAPGLVITTRADYVGLQQRRGFDVSDPHADMTVEDIGYLVSYMLKRPDSMKRLIVDPEDETKNKLKTTRDGYSGKLALQMGRILSLVTPFDMIFGIREGRIPRGIFAQRMRDWEHANRSSPQSVKDFDLSALWARVQKRNPLAGIGKCQLRGWL